GFPLSAELFPCWQSESPGINCAPVARSPISPWKTWPHALGSPGEPWSKWEGSSNAVPDAMVAHLSRALDVLEGEGARFSGDGVSALSGNSPDYPVEAVPPSINSER